MCRVSMDLNVDKNLDFAIYSLVLSKDHEFSRQELANDIMEYQELDEERLITKISLLLKRWVLSGVLQEHLDTFSRI